MITFNANINVPVHIIREIGHAIRNRVILEVGDSKDDGHITRPNISISELDVIMQRVVYAYAASHEKKNNEGWILDQSVVYEIADELLHHRKIMAIKRFREATLTDLREAKLFIDKFGTGIVAHEDFIVAMT